jgi:hypothetical protein
MNIKPNKDEVYEVECPCCEGKGYQTYLTESGKDYDFKCNHCQGGGRIPSETPETEEDKLSTAN